MSNKNKKFGLVANPNINAAVKIAKDIIEYLKNKVDLLITQELYTHLSSKINITGMNSSSLDEFNNHNLDILIAIGGDGTILHALHKCNAKIFGINAGVVGFLTEVHIKDAIKSLDRILNDDFIIEQRIRLKTMLNDRVLEPATNEAVLHTAEIAKMRLYKIQVDNTQAMTLRADGIIIATPTGSTSYAMSAGGPIVDPKVGAFIIVPIAPFKLSARPIVVSSSSMISIQLLQSRRNSVLVIDGQEDYEVTPDDLLKFTISEIPAEFIRFDPNFYRLIEEKLTTQ